MRIIAGQFKGRPLIPPKDQTIRPTSDRTRESLFNLLMHGSYAGRNIVGQPVADLCCGTGALGLEALSRGAASCLFLDRDPGLARTNAERLKTGDLCRYLTGDIANLPAIDRPVSCLFLDAPYDTPFLSQTLAQLAPKGWLLPDALVCVEQGKHEPIHEAPGLTLCDQRSYGKASLRLYRAE